tara:strand:+ start:249 stop:467 length:219 start_codon:yes stop_codon:yes gene_type:complete
MLNSNDYESFIESHAESVMFTLKSQLLERQEKDLLRKALFLYQKNLYQQVGELPENQRDLISEIADKLNLKY